MLSPLLADAVTPAPGMTTTQYVIAIVMSLVGGSGIGMAILTFWGKIKEQRRKDKREDGALEVEQREVERKQREADREQDLRQREAEIKISESRLQKIIDDLWGQIASQRSAMSTIQDETLKKIIAAHDDKHECEKRLAGVEVKLQVAENALATERKNREALEARVHALEGRP